MQANNSTVANSIGLTANKIKKDETILGITGTYEGDGGDYNTKVNTTFTAQKNTLMKNLVEIPLLDISALTDVSRLFFDCSSLISIPELSLNQNVTNLSCMFQNCSSLTILNLNNWNVSRVYTTSNMFQNCSSLVTLNITDWDLSALYSSNFGDMFSNCSSLSNDSLNSILKAISTATNTATFNRKLSVLGLTETQAEICTTLSNWQLAENAGWTTGY